MLLDEPSSSSEARSSHGWERGDRAYPYWDENISSMVVAHFDDWLVSVSPMIFNDRVLLTHRSDYPRCWTAGWCYPKGGAAHLAAAAWDVRAAPAPVGWLKVAGDQR